MFDYIARAKGKEIFPKKKEALRNQGFFDLYEYQEYNRREACLKTHNMTELPEFIKSIDNYEKSLLATPQLIKNSGLKDIYIMNLLGMTQGTYYKRMKDPTKWTLQEIKLLVKILR